MRCQTQSIVQSWPTSRNRVKARAIANPSGPFARLAEVSTISFAASVWAVERATSPPSSVLGSSEIASDSHTSESKSASGSLRIRSRSVRAPSASSTARLSSENQTARRTPGSSSAARRRGTFRSQCQSQGQPRRRPVLLSHGLRSQASPPIALFSRASSRRTSKGPTAYWSSSESRSTRRSATEKPTSAESLATRARASRRVAPSAPSQQPRASLSSPSQRSIWSKGA